MFDLKSSINYFSTTKQIPCEFGKFGVEKTGSRKIRSHFRKWLRIETPNFPYPTVCLMKLVHSKYSPQRNFIVWIFVCWKYNRLLCWSSYKRQSVKMLYVFTNLAFLSKSDWKDERTLVSCQNQNLLSKMTWIIWVFFSL